MILPLLGKWSLCANDSVAACQRLKTGSTRVYVVALFLSTRQKSATLTFKPQRLCSISACANCLIAIGSEAVFFLGGDFLALTSSRLTDLSPLSDWQMSFSQSALAYKHTSLDKRDVWVPESVNKARQPCCFRKKKILNRVDCQRSEKESKTHKRLQERFLIQRNRTKRANFRGKPLFRATYNRKQLNQLISCPFDARKLAGGEGHETAQTW